MASTAAATASCSSSSSNKKSQRAKPSKVSDSATPPASTGWTLEAEALHFVNAGGFHEVDAY